MPYMTYRAAIVYDVFFKDGNIHISKPFNKNEIIPVHDISHITIGLFSKAFYLHLKNKKIAFHSSFFSVKPFLEETGLSYHNPHDS
jgi:hypothetical protein